MAARLLDDSEYLCSISARMAQVGSPDRSNDCHIDLLGDHYSRLRQRCLRWLELLAFRSNRATLPSGPDVPFPDVLCGSLGLDPAPKAGEAG